MIKQLVQLANHLDSRGLIKEASYLDSIIKKAQAFTPKGLDDPNNIWATPSWRYESDLRNVAPETIGKMWEDSGKTAEEWLNTRPYTEEFQKEIATTKLNEYRAKKTKTPSSKELSVTEKYNLLVAHLDPATTFKLGEEVYNKIINGQPVLESDLSPKESARSRPEFK